MLTQRELFNLLKDECKRAGSATEWARRHGIAPAYVLQALNGNRNIGKKIAASLGYKKVVLYKGNDET